MEFKCEHIDANALKERAIRVCTVNALGNRANCYFKAVGTNEIDKAPTVDAVEVVHGRWEQHCFEMECSKCNGEALRDAFNQYVLSFYCPNCGAKMDGDGNG